jgi:protein-tyrosine-phosphatase
MAEAIARQDALQEIEASSAGLAPLGFVAELTTQTLRKNGYAVDGLASKPITLAAWDSADIVINMSGRPSAGAFRNFRGHAKAEDWENEDPYGDATKYQSTYEAVRHRVADLILRIKKDRAVRGDTKDESASPRVRSENPRR